MALYRQIAGSLNGHNGNIGLTYNFQNRVSDLFGLNPIQTVQPSTPITPGAPFADTQSWAPIDLGPSTLPTSTDFPTTTIPPEFNPLQPDQPADQVQPSIPLPLPTDTKTIITNNILPLAALAGVILVAVKGIDLLGDKRKIVLLGGLGLLYYGMAKNKLV